MYLGSWYDMSSNDSRIIQCDMLLDTVSKSSVNQPLISLRQRPPKTCPSISILFLDTVTNIYNYCFIVEKLFKKTFADFILQLNLGKYLFVFCLMKYPVIFLMCKFIKKCVRSVWNNSLNESNWTANKFRHFCKSVCQIRSKVLFIRKSGLVLTLNSKCTAWLLKYYQNKW